MMRGVICTDSCYTNSKFAVSVVEIAGSSENKGEVVNVKIVIRYSFIFFIVIAV
jgi:hypothetical protein